MNEKKSWVGEVEVFENLFQIPITNLISAKTVSNIKEMSSWNKVADQTTINKYKKIRSHSHICIMNHYVLG